MLLLKRGQTVIWAALLSALLPTAARCQTLPTGIVNAPPTVIGAGESIGSDTTLNVFDNGVVGVNFSAGLNDGSSTNVLVNISGGTIGDGFTANGGSVLTISGGELGTVEAQAGSELVVQPGGVLRERLLLTESTLQINGGVVLAEEINAFQSTINLNSGVIDADPTVPSVYEVNLFAGSTLNVNAGILEEIRTLNALPGSTVNVNGGTVESVVGVESGSTFNLRDGFVEASLFGLHPGADMNISGGEFSTLNRGDFFPIGSGSTVNISGGVAGGSWEALDGGAIDISGGEVDGFEARAGSTVNIRGGNLRLSGDGRFTGGGPTGFNSFGAADDSMVNFVGSDFAIDGVPLDLSPGETLGIPERGVVLSGNLADGSFFRVGLYVNNGIASSLRVEVLANITVTQVVPEPGAGLLAAFAIASSSVRRRQH